MTDWDEAEHRAEKAHEFYERGRWEERFDGTGLKSDYSQRSILIMVRGISTLGADAGHDGSGGGGDLRRTRRAARRWIPEDVEILSNLGVDSARTGKFDEAITFFKKMEEIDPSLEAAYCHRILAHAEKGEHEQAEEMFYLARQYKEKCPLCFFNMGHSLSMRGAYDKALWCWGQVLELEPEYPQVHARIAEGLWAKGQLAEARGHFLEELRANPGDIDTLLDLGELLIEMGQTAAAAEKFRHILELDPEECTACIIIWGSWRQEGGDLDLAREQFRPGVAERCRIFRGALCI